MNQDFEVLAAARPEATAGARPESPAQVLGVVGSGGRDHATTRRLADQTRRLTEAQRTLQVLLEECRREIERLKNIAPAAAPWRDDQRLLLGAVEVLPMRQTVVNRSRTYRLTPTEWQLLAYLLSHARQVLTRAELATGAWGLGFASRASEVEVYISRLRKKLDAPGEVRLIETVRGVGYRLTAAPQSAGHEQAAF